MGQNLIGGACWYRKKQTLDLPFIPNHLQIHKRVFKKEFETKGKQMGQFITKAQKSYIQSCQMF